MTTLRGARVEVDSRRVGQVALGACLLTLAALVVVFFVVGINKNAQINELRQHGVPVEVTVTNCIGLLGGSGSNEAGYACRGTFSLDGHRYREAIPGDVLRAPGSTVNGVAAPGDLGLFSTASEVAHEHASWKVFVLPVVLLLVLVLACAVLLLRRRSAGAVLVRRARTGG